MLVITQNFISRAMIVDPATSRALSDRQKPLTHPIAATQTPFSLKLLTERAGHRRAHGFSGQVSERACQLMCFVVFEV